jgi:cytidylate kinase
LESVEKGGFILIIAIDGPAGSGKSTVAKILAQRLNLFYLDTGALYRALTLKALRAGVNMHNVEEVVSLFNEFDINLQSDSQGETRVILSGEDVSREIRSPEVGQFVSLISSYPEVRKKMLSYQRKLAERGAVAEGRDTTTVVFPHADLKIFLTAEKEERVKRRLKEWRERGIEGSYSDALKDIEKRDKLDSEREYAPLKKSEDAVVIDTTNLDPQSVADKILTLLKEKGTCSGK